MITMVTVAVAASLLVAVSLSKSEPESPANPEGFGTGETQTFDFDNEMIFDVSGTSSDSTVIESTESSSGASDESSNITTDDDTSSKETPDEPDESTSEDEPQPTDPSQTNNDDPEPVITTPVQITNDPQTEPKPTESTTKKPQTEPKPTETTTKTPQTEPKPTETTTKAPQTDPKPTETQPQEDSPQQNGQFSVKEKKYDYNGANVSILQVENKSQQAYTITITGKFKDSSGKVVKTESKTFEGFQAGWSNYFIFQPGVKYSSVTWGMETAEFNGDTLAQCLSPGTHSDTSLLQTYVDDNGKAHTAPVTPDCKLETAIKATLYSTFKYDGDELLGIKTQFAVVDGNGELITISNARYLGQIATTNGEEIPWGEGILLCGTGYSWADRDKYVMPDRLKNITVIRYVVSVVKE